MARKKKKSLVWKAAGLAARGVLKRRIVEKEQVRAAAPAKSGRGILPAKAGKPVVDTALYHALGGKASKESLQEKAMKKALKEEGRKKAFRWPSTPCHLRWGKWSILVGTRTLIILTNPISASLPHAKQQR